VEFSWSPRDGEPALVDIGEDAALELALPILPASRARLLGPGDDAAVIAAPDGRFVVTGDTMIEGPDFRQEWTTPESFGWKLVATNLADIAAMGAEPVALVMSIAVPGDARASVLAEMARGMRDACLQLAPGCGIEGGDLARSSVITGAATAFGDLDGRAPVLRSGARPGDVVAVSGGLGLASRGLALLFERATEDGAPDEFALARLRAAASEDELAALDAQLWPRPPIADGVLAALAGATAMLDVSDGLALDASRIARASGVALALESARIEEAAGGAERCAEWSVERVLAGGEDHALLAAFPPDAALPGGFRAIGRVEAGSGLLVDGRPYAGPLGWDPFRP